MRKTLVACLFATSAVMIFISFGCNKEKIVESTQYIHDTKYVDLPPDTVWRTDTLVRHDSSVVYRIDTLRVHDTVKVTVTVYDTVQTVKNYYDTVVVRDTVVKTQFSPSAATAISAMELQTDPLIFDFAFQNFGDSTGWTFYLSPAQMSGSKVATGVYDIDSYAAYFNTDLSAYYPLEIYWRMTYKGGDPSDANNWSMSDPPAAAPGKVPGISASLRSITAFQLSPASLLPMRQR